VPFSHKPQQTPEKILDKYRRSRSTAWSNSIPSKRSRLFGSARVKLLIKHTIGVWLVDDWPRLERRMGKGRCCGQLLSKCG
jgi:hypothetical protein